MILLYVKLKGAKHILKNRELQKSNEAKKRLLVSSPLLLLYFFILYF